MLSSTNIRDIGITTPLELEAAITLSLMTSGHEDRTPNVGAISTFSTGLVQISGLATVIGGHSLEELSIGLKAASGLAWAPISTFGLLKAMKMWIAGAVPNSLRDVLGLRSAVIDDAIG